MPVTSNVILTQTQIQQNSEKFVKPKSCKVRTNPTGKSTLTKKGITSGHDFLHQHFNLAKLQINRNRQICAKTNGDRTSCQEVIGGEGEGGGQGEGVGGKG